MRRSIRYFHHGGHAHLWLSKVTGIQRPDSLTHSSSTLTTISQLTRPSRRRRLVRRCGARRIKAAEASDSISSANTSEGFFQLWILRGRSFDIASRHRQILRIRRDPPWTHRHSARAWPSTG